MATRSSINNKNDANDAKNFFSRDGTPYLHRDEGGTSTSVSSFDQYEIINLGVLLVFIEKVQHHSRNCKGSLVFSKHTRTGKSYYKGFRGGFFNVVPLSCSCCGDVLELETDVFSSPPTTNERKTQHSILLERCGVAAKNMSFCL